MIFIIITVLNMIALCAIFYLHLGCGKWLDHSKSAWFWLNSVKNPLFVGYLPSNINYWYHILLSIMVALNPRWPSTNRPPTVSKTIRCILIYLSLTMFELSYLMFVMLRMLWLLPFLYQSNCNFATPHMLQSPWTSSLYLQQVQINSVNSTQFNQLCLVKCLLLTLI